MTRGSEGPRALVVIFLQYHEQCYLKVIIRLPGPTPRTDSPCALRSAPSAHRALLRAHAGT
jgi:hypothetical protein